MIASKLHTDLARPDDTQGTLDNDHCERIAELLAEVNTLAIRFRQSGKTITSDQSDLPGGEHAVLEIIDRFGPLTVPQIARQRSTSRQNIQIMVDRLEDKGCVELVGNPGHRRSALVRLTEQGKTWLDAGEKDQKELLSKIGSILSGSEASLVVSLLRKVCCLLSAEKQAGGAVQSASIKPALVTPERVTLTLPVEMENEVEEFPINLL